MSKKKKQVAIGGIILMVLGFAVVPGGIGTAVCTVGVVLMLWANLS